VAGGVLTGISLVLLVRQECFSNLGLLLILVRASELSTMRGGAGTKLESNEGPGLILFLMVSEGAVLIESKGARELGSLLILGRESKLSTMQGRVKTKLRSRQESNEGLALILFLMESEGVRLHVETERVKTWVMTIKAVIAHSSLGVEIVDVGAEIASSVVSGGGHASSPSTSRAMVAHSLLQVEVVDVGAEIASSVVSSGGPASLLLTATDCGSALLPQRFPRHVAASNTSTNLDYRSQGINLSASCRFIFVCEENLASNISFKVGGMLVCL
jgi:hypothetical protein